MFSQKLKMVAACHSGHGQAPSPKGLRHLSSQCGGLSSCRAVTGPRGLNAATRKGTSEMSQTSKQAIVPSSTRQGLHFYKNNNKLGLTSQR